jgi:AraC family transcriptional regulator
MRRELKTEARCESLPHAVHTGTSVARFATAGCVVAEHVYPPGQRSENHAHESPFIHTTLAGESVDEIRAKRTEPRTPGDVGFIPAGCDHSPTQQGSGSRVLTIDILPKYATEFIEGGADFTQPFVVSEPAIFGLARRLQGEIRNPDSLSRFQVDALIVEISVSLLRFRRVHETASTPRWLKRAVATIEERYKEDLSLDALAAELKVHPVHLCRTFRRCYGETLSDHIRRLRIKEARRLLEDGAASIAEISAELGYYDESHFSKAFKRVVGTTPARYREIVRESPPILA